MKRWLRSASPAEAVTPSATRQRRDPLKRRARLALAAVLVALPLGALGTQAGALTPWRTFGNGTAQGARQSRFRSRRPVECLPRQRDAREPRTSSHRRPRSQRRQGQHPMAHALWEQRRRFRRDQGLLVQRSAASCCRPVEQAGGSEQMAGLLRGGSGDLFQIRRGHPFAPGPLLTPTHRRRGRGGRRRRRRRCP